jgi:hypothetical protein
MANNVDQILSWVSLTPTVEVIKAGIPNPLPPKLFSTTIDVPGDKAQYINTYGTRRVARRIPFSGPPISAPKQPIAETSVKLIQVAQEMVFDQELWQQLREFAEYSPQRKFAMQLIDFQGEQLRMMFENTRTAAVGYSYSQGKIWFDADGALLPSATGAYDTFDQQIPSANTGTITDANSVGGVVVNSPWSLPTTDIVTQVNTIKKLAAQRGGGYPPKYALYGTNIPGYISQNEVCQALFPFFADQAKAITNQGKVPDGFLDLEWIPMQNMFYDDGTTNNEIFRPDYVTFLPEINQSTYTMFQGTRMVPKSFSLAESAPAAMSSYEPVTGMGRYAYPNFWNGVPTLVDVGFDTFAPLIKVPNAVFIMNTCP